MSYETLLYVWDAFTFLLFLVVLISSLQVKTEVNNNKKLIIVSLFLFLGMFLFYREQLLLHQGSKSEVLTFFTYGFSSLAHMLIVTMIVTLYTKVTLSNRVNALIVLYALIVGLIMAVNVNVGSFLSTHILMGIINMIPLIHLFIYIIVFDKKYYKNVFFIQVILLAIVYTIKTINLIINFDSISFTSDNYIDIGMLTIANVIIFSFILSYLNIRNSFINQELLAHRKIIEESLSDAISLSEKDVLTGVYNRRKIHDVLQSYYEVESNQDHVFSIVLIDVDNFKEINDSFGHNVGDEVLMYISSVLRKSLREKDYVSRWGGDEFLLLLPNTDSKNCNYFVKKIKGYLANTICEYTKSYISISSGIADSRECDNIEMLLHLADQRMYQDKI